MELKYWCSEYGGVYVENKQQTSAFKLMVFINKERVATFIVPPLLGGFHFIGMVAVPKTPFSYEIIKC